MNMAMKMIARLQLEERAKMKMMIKMIMMSVILRRNQARRKEGRSLSAWVGKSFNSILNLMKDSLYVLKTRSYK